MKTNVEIFSYNSAWPDFYKAEAEQIEDVLKTNFIAIHHVGSTSVPGLAAKPKIDIIAEVKSLDFDDLALLALGYQYRGGFNILLRKSYTKRGDLNVNLHIFEKNDPEIELNLLFTNYLRHNPQARDEYQQLKYEIIQQESAHQMQNLNGISYRNYTLDKAAFIQNIIKKIGFDGSLFHLCAHPHEWDQYHRIRKEQIFKPIAVEYDPNHPTIKAQNHRHIILIKGTIVVAIAHLELIGNDIAALRSLAVDETYKKQGFGKKMIQLIEKWLRLQKVSKLVMHSRLSAEDFYRKLGYSECEFDDPCIQERYIDLGKML